MITKSDSKQHIKSLDGLRGYAALAVCIYHGTDIFGMKHLIPHAYLAVDLFFVLSGFVLFYRYHREMSGFDGANLDLWDYLAQRFARLYPLYLFATLIGIAFYWFMFIHHGNFGANFKSLWDMADNSIFLIPYLEPNITNPTKKIFPYAHQAWSIFWELILSFCFYFTIRWGKIAEIAIASAAILGVIITTYSIQDIDEGWRNIHFEVGLFRAFAAFYLGVLIGRIYNLCSNCNNGLMPHFMSVLSSMILVIIIYYFHFLRETKWVIELIVLYAVFPVLILSSALSSASVLSFFPFQFLGRISYSIYLLHGTATLIALWSMHNYDWFEGSVLTGLLWLGIVVAFSFVTYRTIEVPMRQLLRKSLLNLASSISQRLNLSREK